MKTTDRPNDKDTCARETCGHEFGRHYLTNDGKKFGCGWEMDSQYQGYDQCRCTGFLISYVWPARAIPQQDT